MPKKKQKSLKNGFTLIETVIALGVFMLVTLGVVNMTAFSSNAMERVSVRGELLENARIALDMMSVYIRSADEIDIRTDSDKQGLKLMTVKVSSGGSGETREFRYSSLLSPTDVRYHRLEFGGNELASYISRVSVRLDGNILTLSVLTDDRLSADAKTAVEPVGLTAKIKVYNPIVVRE